MPLISSTSFEVWTLLSRRHLFAFKEGDSDSKVRVCFVLNLSYQQILKLLKVIAVLGYTLRHSHKRISIPQPPTYGSNVST